MENENIYDELTGLPGKALLWDRLGQALARARRHGTLVAVFFCDLDNFKFINDSFSHTVGDVALEEIIDRLKEVVRAEDTIARLGGDEFVVVAEELTDIETAVNVAKRIQSIWERPIVLPTVPARKIQVTGSLGVAISSPLEEAPKTLLSHADIAMYYAKSLGPGRIQIFDRKLEQFASERNWVGAAMTAAEDEGQLHLDYQPIVELSSGHVVAVEALLRWDHPKRGMIAPDKFIPLAEEVGVINSLGRWVMGESMRRVSTWNAAHPEEEQLKLCVNVSPYQILNADIIADVKEALEKSGLAPGALQLELTESLKMEGKLALDKKTPEEVVQGLRDLGVELSLDDFGSQHGSLKRLRNFHFGIIKIDRSFISMVGTEGEESGFDEVFLAAITTMCRTLDIDVVAEGIETKEQLERVRELGCHLGQGHYLARPMRWAAVKLWMEARAGGE